MKYVLHIYLEDKHITLPRNISIQLPPDKALRKPENSQICIKFHMRTLTI
jgi:hypothetical protein